MTKPIDFSAESQEAHNIDDFAELDIDPSSLDPSKHYRVIQYRSTRLARARAQGYKPVTAGSGVRRLSQRPLVDGGPEGDEQDAFDADGLFRIGDGILCEVPKQTKQERDQRQDKLKRARLSAPEGKFRKKAKDSGFEVNDKKERG